MPVAQAKAEAQFVTEVLQLKGGVVLDLACGYGRHARHLARSNQVVALDINSQYLANARRGLRGAAANRLQLVQADMRQVPVASATMDAVLLLFNSFGYFGGESANGSTGADAPRQQLWKLPQVFYERQLVPDEFGRFVDKSQSRDQAAVTAEDQSDGNRVVLEEIARALKNHGQFMTELPNPGPLLAAVAKEPRRHVVTAHYEIEEQYDWDASCKVLHNRTRFSSKGRREEGEYHLRLYSLAQMKALLADVGLKFIQSYGDYDGKKYSPANSPVLLVHARKQ